MYIVEYQFKDLTSRIKPFPVQSFPMSCKYLYTDKNYFTVQIKLGLSSVNNRIIFLELSAF